MDNQDSSVVKHCGYCSEGHDGNCDGVQCDISEGKVDRPVRAPNEVDTGEIGNTSVTLPSVQSGEGCSFVRMDVTGRVLGTCKECKEEYYVEDTEVKDMEDKAKLLADCKKMKYWIMTEPCTCKMSSNRPCRACVLNNGFLSAFSYTDSPTA